MLILTRRVDETVMIGQDIAIIVLGVRGNQVRIGITAPKEIVVHREEIVRKDRAREGWRPLKQRGSRETAQVD